MHISRVFFRCSDLIHHPLRNYKRYPNVKRDLNIVYKEGFGDETKYDVYYPINADKKLPVLFNIHGGGFVRGDKKFRSGIARYFANHGWFVVNINYRLPPKTLFPEGAIDCMDALNTLPALAEKYPIDLDKVVVTGDSAGGYYAAETVAATLNEELRVALSLPKYEGRPIRALLTFCAPFDMMKSFGCPAPLGVTVDVTNCLFGTSYTTPGVDPDFKYLKEVNVLNYVGTDFPENFVVVAQNDSFCGGQLDDVRAKFDEKGIKYDFYIAKEKGDGHCTHLLPYKLGTPKCLNTVDKFLDNIKGE